MKLLEALEIAFEIKAQECRHETVGIPREATVS
ncbi:hypothetical protein AsAng_0002680 [Aureispira anguillae]|uniref:Uncharacterized protein n=1 Tax=Aureispira anguillae TaxID=2864201 RepID=A0A915VMR1_9BACT|nr:hypothetical protein AsAng_0002680 [Aureispira anguillae]